MAEADHKVKKMVIKVDLQCCKCYKKIKKVVCRYPREIRDQIYDEKNNRVFIRVVCCNPECIMEKIICKAGDTVESIEIIPDKPMEPPKPEKPKVMIVEPPKEAAKPPAPAPAPKPPILAPPPKAPEPVVQGFPWPPPQDQVPMYPIGVCCCCEGGPGYCIRGPTCYDGSGRPAYEYQGSNRGYYMSRCDEYLSEENASGCSVM